MRKILVVAANEFGSAVRTKAFLISILLLPILMGGSIGVQLFASRQVDTRPKSFAVIDRTGVLYDGLAAAAEARNAAVAGGSRPDPAKAGPRRRRDGDDMLAAPFRPEKFEPGSATPEQSRLDLSDRVRREALFAFVEIPAEILAPGSKAEVLYHSDHPSVQDLPRWVEAAVSAGVQARRFREAKVDPAVVAALGRPVALEVQGLVERAADGSIKPAEKVDIVRTLVAPGALMFLLFMVVMAGAPQMLNGVLEEKMSRISEVLLGSVTPFQLMMGKLLGGAGVSLVLAVLYVGGAFAVAAYYGYGDVVSPGLLAAFLMFLMLAVFLFGSLYLAIGASCSELKDAQTLMTPVMLLTIFPILLWTAVIESPGSPLSVGASLFPPATPYLMLLRMALRPAPPAWQVALSVALTAATAVACVWGAGKIFRTGLLMQGKPPTFAELGRWVFAR